MKSGLNLRVPRPATVPGRMAYSAPAPNAELGTYYEDRDPASYRHALPPASHIGANGDLVDVEDRAPSRGFMRQLNVGLVITGAVILALIVAVMILFSTWDRIEFPGPTGPAGPIGPPGVITLNSTLNDTATTTLRIEETLLFGDNASLPDATIFYNDTTPCLQFDAPAVCLPDVIINGDISGNFTFNPLSIGVCSLEEDGSGELSVSCPMALPLTMDSVGDFSTTQGDTCLAFAGACFEIDAPFLQVNTTIAGAWTAPDCPDLSEGFEMSGLNAELKFNGGNAATTLLTTADFIIETLAPGELAVHANITENLTLGGGACVEFTDAPGGTVCMDGGCLTLDAPDVCFQGDTVTYDNTNIEFVNGAEITGDVTIDGDLTVNNDIVMLGAFEICNLNVTCNATIAGTLEVGGEITAFDTFMGTDVVSNTVATGSVTTNTITANLGVSTFNAPVTFNQNTAFNSPGIQSINTGATIRVQTGGAFTSGAGASALCDAPLFTPASGCVETCPDLSTCTLLFENLDVERVLRIGSTGNVDPATSRLELGLPDNRTLSADLHADTVDITGDTIDLLGRTRKSDGARELQSEVLTPPLCDPGTTCTQIDQVIFMEQLDQRGGAVGRTTLASLEIDRTCPGPSAECEADFFYEPDFPTDTLMDDGDGLITPGGGFGTDIYEVVDAAALDLEGAAGRAELFATQSIDIGNGARAWTATATPPIITMHGDVTVTGVLTAVPLQLSAPVLLTTFAVTSPAVTVVLGASAGTLGGLAGNIFTAPKSAAYAFTLTSDFTGAGGFARGFFITIAGTDFPMCDRTVHAGFPASKIVTCSYTRYFGAGTSIEFKIDSDFASGATSAGGAGALVTRQLNIVALY